MAQSGRRLTARPAESEQPETEITPPQSREAQTQLFYPQHLSTIFRILLKIKTEIF
ncbi:hypothetical protein [Fictibacillus phosphorivorans]|uniref:hypothetical protein n=1 Tax=Fictibacillus phosphorivorans TaxID=1221500 RepID=UPI0035E5BDAE